MGIQSNINSALGTLRILGALKSGKNYIDKNVQKGAQSVRGAAEEVKSSVEQSAESVKGAAQSLEKKFITWMDKDGTEMFGKKPNYSPEEQAMWDSYREEQDAILEDKRLANAYRARVAYDAVSDKLISKQTARDNVRNMKSILRGDINLDDLEEQIRAYNPPATDNRQVDHNADITDEEKTQLLGLNPQPKVAEDKGLTEEEIKNLTGGAN